MRREEPTVQLSIVGIEARSRLGVYAWERQREQPVRVDLTADLAAPAHDRLAETVDYAQVAGAVREIAVAESCLLVETFASLLAEQLAAKFKFKFCRVVVHKPMAAAFLGATDLSVTAEAHWPSSSDEGSSHGAGKIASSN